MRKRGTESIELSTKELDGINQSNILRTPRKRTVSLKQAFDYLANGKYEDFLTHFTINKKFHPAITALGNFGQGGSKKLMTKFWKAHWNGNLIITKLDPIKGKCCACNRTKILTHEMSISDNNSVDVENIKGIGPDCYSIKFKPLLNLVDCCNEIAQDYDILSRRADDLIQHHIDEIQISGSKMREKYNWK